MLENREIRDIRDVVDTAAEAAIVASLVQKPELIFYSEHLLPQHFSNEQNKCLYATIKLLTSRGITKIDAFNLMHAIETEKSLMHVASGITLDKVKLLLDESPSIARNSPEDYKLCVQSVMDKAFRRDMYEGLTKCVGLCLNPENEDVKKSIYNTIDNTIGEYSAAEEIPPYKDVVDKMWQEIEKRQAAGYAGVPFKFPALNEYVTCERGELIIFGAQQKVGKSIMLLNIAADLANQGYSVLYIDSELSSRLFTARLLSHLTGIAYRDLTAGAYDGAGKQKINDALAKTKSWRFTHLYMPFFDQEGIYTAAKQVANRDGLDVIIVDYFKATGNEMDAYQTYAAMGRCVDLVKNEIAGSMNIMAIGAAQATIHNKLADSAKIARNASTIIMIEDKTPEEIEADGIECGNKKLVVRVNRNGAQMVEGEYIDLKFDGDHILYEQAKQHERHEPF